MVTSLSLVLSYDCFRWSEPILTYIDTRRTGDITTSKESTTSHMQILNLQVPHSIFISGCCQHGDSVPESKVHGVNMGPTLVLLAPGGPHVGFVNLAIWGGLAVDTIVSWPNPKQWGIFRLRLDNGDKLIGCKYALLITFAGLYKFNIFIMVTERN